MGWPGDRNWAKRLVNDAGICSWYRWRHGVSVEPTCEPTWVSFLWFFNLQRSHIMNRMERTLSTGQCLSWALGNWMRDHPLPWFLCLLFYGPLVRTRLRLWNLSLGLLFSYDFFLSFWTLLQEKRSYAVWSFTCSVLRLNWSFKLWSSWFNSQEAQSFYCSSVLLLYRGDILS